MYIPRMYFQIKDAIFRFHVVQRGETLAAIAARYGLEPQALAVVNGIAEPGQLQTGQFLALISP